MAGVFNGADEAMITHPILFSPSTLSVCDWYIQQSLNALDIYVMQEGGHTYTPKSTHTHTLTHKSCFMGDNAMTANLLEGFFYFFYFILYLSIASAFTRQFVRCPAGREGSINLDFHYHAPPPLPRSPFPCILSPAHPFKIKPTPKRGGSSVIMKVSHFSWGKRKRLLQGHSKILHSSLLVVFFFSHTLSIFISFFTSSPWLTPALCLFISVCSTCYPSSPSSLLSSFSVLLSSLQFLSSLVMLPPPLALLLSPWQWFNKQCLQSGLAQSVANYPVTLPVLWDGQD